MPGRDQDSYFWGDKNYFWEYTNCRMKVTFDQDKRDRTVKDRGLAFEDAVEMFEGVRWTASMTGGTTARLA